MAEPEPSVDSKQRESPPEVNETPLLESGPLKALQGGKSNSSEEAIRGREIVDESIAQTGKGTAIPGPNDKSFTWEKLFLYAILTIVVALLLLAAFWFSAHVSKTYDAISAAAIDAYRSRDLLAGDAMIYAFAFARARDAAVIKGGGLLLSFLVVVLGTMVVLKGTEALYTLRFEDSRRKSALETSSPGLVMITLGLALAYGVISHQSEISVSGSESAGENDQDSNNESLPSDTSPNQPLDPSHDPLPSGSRP